MNAPKPAERCRAVTQPSSLAPLFLRHGIARSPGLVKPRFERAVEAQDREPSSAGNGLNPVTLFTRRRLGTKVDIVGAVSVLLDSRAVASFREKKCHPDIQPRNALTHGDCYCDAAKLEIIEKAMRNAVKSVEPRVPFVRRDHLSAAVRRAHFSSAVTSLLFLPCNSRASAQISWRV